MIMATVNQQIDALLKRRGNPALSEEDATFVREARAKIKELDALVLAAIDKRQWTTADKLDTQRGKLWKAIDVREGRHPRSNNPAKKSAARSVVLVAAKNQRKAKARITCDEYETQYSKDGKTWNRWNVVCYEDMARKIARDVSRDFPTYSVRVVKL